MKLVTVAQMREIEKEADANGLTYAEMMENAGRGLAEIVNEVAFDDDWEEVLGLVGPGNNGGDTLVALTHLVEAGWHARAYVVKRKKKDELVARFIEAGGEVTFADSDKDLSALDMCFESADILLDGLLGTGIKLPLKAEIASVLEQSLFIMAELEEPPYIIAVDCPSGVDCDSGEAALECLPADLTVTMAAVKRGLLKLPAFEFVGDLALVDIGLPDDLASFYDLKTEVADLDLVAGLLPERDLDSHKGTFGTALIVAGSINYTGAAYLAGAAAYRSGAGLVTMAVPSPLHGVLAGQLPEATWVLLPHEMGNIAGNALSALTKSLESASALLVGPGLGLEAKTREFLEGLLTGKSNAKKQTSQIGFVRQEANEDAPITLPPMVVDADGLKLLAKISDWHKLLSPLSVLTPHPGEMAALTGLSKDEIQNDRETIAAKFAREWGHVVVLKGAFTVIASPHGQMTVIPVASPALARAGTGDVLAGLIVGLRAQGLDAYDAAVAGAYIHAEAGLIAAEDLGTTACVLASDVLNSIVDVMSELE
ncbi:NAD(P)H-hydrate dehydratase [Candidatus Villigracilis saccharophilus]|uniref:NAD(P)H-hydrate dehydratase n=1 Tax=Candidatus Villigracilis saccharophilus TaxID=3140684 RepID=UPI003137648F|nr:NAD(P)H-hydrate dehydratase [Anaerolineales bacterium]